MVERSSSATCTTSFVSKSQTTTSLPTCSGSGTPCMKCSACAKLVASIRFASGCTTTS
jgi:hypothetical protein